MAASPNYVAGDDINPSRLVIYSGDFEVTQGADNTAPFAGVSQEGTRQPPGVDGSDGLAAHAGEPLHVYGPGEECLVTLAATLTAGMLLGSDSVGLAVEVDPTGVPAAATYYAGILLEGGDANEKRRMLVQPGVLPDATA